MEITGNISDISLDDAKNAILAASDSMNIPPEYSIYLAGQSMEQDVAFSSMMFAIFLAIVSIR